MVWFSTKPNLVRFFLVWFSSERALVYQFDHQKGRGDKEALEKNMRETMPIEIVREVFVNHLENKVSRFGKKYNVFETT